MNEVEGLSPRGRGNRSTSSTGATPPGAIPARAGEPGVGANLRLYERGYPRAGGGTADFNDVLCELAGAIPARAGEPRRRLEYRGRSGGYPRAGGGTPVFSPDESRGEGLSPRGRGNRLDAGGRDP